MCGAVTTPAFTYAIMPNAFPFISFVPTTGAVTISAASVAGSYSITIQGTIPRSTGQIIL